MADLQERLNELGVTITASHAGQHSEQDTSARSGARSWDYDLWICALSYDGRTITTEFRTGLGLRVESPRHRMPTPPYRPGTIAHAEWESHKVPVAPSTADVIACLISDAYALETDIDTWCDDNDCRPSLYFACQASGRKVVELLGHHVAELRELDH